MDPVLLLIVALAVVAAALPLTWRRSRERAEQLHQIAIAASGEARDHRVDMDAMLAVRALRDRADGLGRDLDHERVKAAALIDLVALGILHVSPDLRVDLANQAAHTLLERPPGSIAGKTVVEAFVDPRIESIVRTAAERGAASGDVVLREPDGVALVVRARRLRDGELWVVLEDVTELRQLQRIRTEFIDNLSHELRTPLTTVGLLAETLSRDVEMAGDVIPARMRDRIGKIEIETGHLTQMVNELLALAQIEGGGGRLSTDWEDIGAIAVASVERLRLFAERHGVRLSLDVQPDCPPVMGDEARLGQVFVNLLHNAVKFSPGGGDVIVHVGLVGGEVVAAVEDHGVGIPKEEQARIFERFYKVDRARAKGGGTGLGLAISRHAIAAYGGRIWVESEEGVGSTFSFAIPVAPALPA